MGDAAGEGRKPPRNAAVDGDGATTRRRASVTPVEHEHHHRPVPLRAAAAAAAGVAGGYAAAHQSSGGEEEDDDEQVETFYALLANIRALRGLYRVGESRLPPAAGRGRKRAREEEAPWRPAFRMEDFEEEEVSRQATGDAGTGCAVGARRPAVTGARAAAADDRDEDDAADESRGGRKLGRRVAAQG